MPRVKVCCIASGFEARMAMAAGASALGLVSAMPSGPGPIDEALIAEIVSAVPSSIDTFLLTALQHAGAIVAQHRRCGTSVLQLVDALPLDPGNPTLAVQQIGGAGRTHDWTVSHGIRDSVRAPVWLTGGLVAHNVAAAVAAVQPHGVDLCNGVRSQGRLDATKLQSFFAALPRGPA